MKKLIVLLLAAAMLLSMTACGTAQPTNINPIVAETSLVYGTI